MRSTHSDFVCRDKLGLNNGQSTHWSSLEHLLLVAFHVLKSTLTPQILAYWSFDSDIPGRSYNNPLLVSSNWALSPLKKFMILSWSNVNERRTTTYVFQILHLICLVMDYRLACLTPQYLERSIRSYFPLSYSNSSQKLIHFRLSYNGEWYNRNQVCNLNAHSD